MAKTAAERQRDRRARLKAEGKRKTEYVLEPDEERMLDELCRLRRPGKSPYAHNEMLGLLIIQSHRQLKKKLDSMKGKTCKNCGKELPVAECNFTREPGCWRIEGPAELLVKIE